MEDHLPGWRAAGCVHNITDPNWKPGHALMVDGKKDVWQADARGLILRDIREAMAALGVPEDNFVCRDMLDPADTHGEFSSHENRERFGDTRDLYLIAHSSAFIQGE